MITGAVVEIPPFIMMKGDCIEIFESGIAASDAFDAAGYSKLDGTMSSLLLSDSLNPNLVRLRV